jgi:YD repeat-containing protein
MPGCNLLVTGIPDPLPDSPIFLYVDKNGNPVPPPNYVPNLNDCREVGCGCGCSGASGPSMAGAGCGCGGAFNPPCGGDPGAAQLQAVNKLLQLASQELAVTNVPGWLEAWNGQTGNLLRQFSVPTVDPIAPTPVFTYNSDTSMQSAHSEFGAGFAMVFKQSVNSVGSSTAVINKGSGASFTYTNKNMTTGVYTAPPNVLNKLLQNSSGTWTESQPDGLTLNYNTSGQLATIKRSSDTWTMTYNGSGLMTSIKDPVNRLSTFAYHSQTNPPGPTYLRRFVDAVGRITTFNMTSNGSFSMLLTSIVAPDLTRTTMEYSPAPALSTWIDPLSASARRTCTRGSVAAGKAISF